ncbi:lysozyme inhibitor LprI family protein [uncultured Maritimibacter sp.]|jgi:uncharacterized protein YecT (DUF1311 family)|uniref:lysozyme inhibitor LprI family protein n=1 Tax=uncultured Maritimibacter sp. TaxID=991866 RepID=UPI002609BE24|nr:lysozyme inhibitor LprI family protein [uncultured Maritimibacter sp.]
MLRSFLALILLAPAPLAAQDLIYDFTDSTACVAAQENWYDKLQCVGTAAANCMENTPGGYSTVGMGGCLWSEMEDWDRELNALYGPTVARLAAEDSEYDSPVSQADALKALQRAWIPYRDAACAYERSKWGGGTGGGPAEADCLMRMTAERAIALQFDRLGN